MIRRPLAWPVDSPLPDFCPTSLDSSLFSHRSSSETVMLTTSSNSALVSSSLLTLLAALLQGLGLVHRVIAALVAADPVLRIVLRGTHLPLRGGGIRGDLLLHLALCRAAVAPPRHPVALVGLLIAP